MSVLRPRRTFIARRRDRFQRYAISKHVGGMLHGGPLEEGLLVEDRERTREDRRSVRPGVHADGVLRAGLDAETADDAAELVDLEPHRILLDGLDVVLAGLDVDALGRAG